MAFKTTDEKHKWDIEMASVAARVQQAIRDGEKAGLTKDSAALGALIGAINSIRVDCLFEDKLVHEARRAAPLRIGDLTTLRN